MLKKNEILIIIVLAGMGFIPAFAVPIEHGYVGVTSSFVTTATTETDVSDVYLTSGNFTTGDKYLIISNAQTLCSVVSCDLEIHIEHGTTNFGESFNRFEQDNTSGWNIHTWFTVWTAVAGEGIQMELIAPTAGTKTVDQASLVVINLSDLTENTDWFYQYNATDFTINGAANQYFGGTVSGTKNGTEINFTPSTAGHDWLVIAYNRVDPGGTTTNYLTRINATGSTTDTQPSVSQEGEDTTNDRWVHYLFRVYENLAASSQTFGPQTARDDTSATATVADSAVFALDIDKFQAHNQFWNVAEQALETDNAYPGTETSTSDITTGQTGDVFIMSQLIRDGVTSSLIKNRQQFDDSGGVLGDAPGTQTSENYPFNVAWDGTDELGWHIFSVNTTTAAATYTLRTDSTSSAAPPVEDRANVAFTMELASTGTTVNVANETAIEDSVSAYISTVNLSDDFAIEDAASHSTMNTVNVNDDFAIEDTVEAVVPGMVTVSDEFAIEDSAGTDAITVSDDFAFEDSVSLGAGAAAPVRNAIAIYLNSPTETRLGGVFSFICPFNSTLTGLQLNGTFICTPMSAFFP